MVVIVQTIYFAFLMELSVLGYPKLKKVYFRKCLLPGLSSNSKHV